MGDNISNEISTQTIEENDCLLYSFQNDSKIFNSDKKLLNNDISNSERKNFQKKIESAYEIAKELKNIDRTKLQQIKIKEDFNINTEKLNNNSIYSMKTDSLI